MSETESFGLRRALQVCMRSVPLLWPVRFHLLNFLFLAGVSAAVVAFFALSLGFDALWEGVLQGKPLSERTAVILGLDPAIYSVQGVDLAAAAVLGVEERQLLRNRLLGALLSLIFVALPMALGVYYYQLWILQRINQVLRTRLVERLQSLSLRFHAGSQVGDSIYRVYQDSAMVTNVIRTLILDPALHTVVLTSMAVLVAVQVDVGLVLLMIALVLPLSLLLAARFSGSLRESFREAREANSALTSRIQESLSALKLVKAFRAERRFQDRFESASRHAFARAFEARDRMMVYSVVLFWLSGVVLTLGILLAAQYTVAQVGLATVGVWAGVATARVWNLGVYSTFQQSGRRVTSGIERLFGLWGSAQDLASGLDRVFEVLDAQPEVQDRPGAVELPGVSDRISYESVCFSYHSDKPTLRDVSFEARVGTITALVGPTGAGKTTLLALLLRLYEPDSGIIRVDGEDLRHYRVDSLRKQIAIALQENLLFAASIRENIRYATPDASDEDVEAAARISCAHDFILQLPNGYDTLLGERGAKLSMGQRQRIGIARALLKDAPVLVLDEPTASLDVETEQALMRNLALWGRRRSLLIVTHRLSTIRRADHIVVLRDGQIVEQGSHTELLRSRGGLYFELAHGELGGAPEHVAQDAAG